MKLIETRRAVRGKKSVKLEVYSCKNTLTYADRSANYFRTIEIRNFNEAVGVFYEWTLQMHNIKTETTIHS